MWTDWVSGTTRADFVPEHRWIAEADTITGDLPQVVATSAQGEELWVTDGTPTGTRQVADIAAGAASSNIGPLQVFGSALFFRADDGISGEELWRATATGAARVADVETGAGSSSPDELTVYGGRVYFAATQGGDLTNGLRVTVGR